MKSKKSGYALTLKDISELLDLKLGIWSDKIRTELKNKIDQSATGIIAEMDKRFGLVDNRFDDIDKRFDEVNRRFDQNNDVHQEIIGAIDEMASRKIKQHCQKFHSVVS